MSAAKGVLRSVKNYTLGCSPIQKKVREATSNDPGSAPESLLAEIAQATYNPSDFVGVMEILDKKLNDKGRYWRHVFKALRVLEHCICFGSIVVADYMVDNLFVVKTLREFQYIDDSGRDQGANVRQKAKALTSLLLDRTALEEARKNRNYAGGFHNGDGLYRTGYSESTSRLPQRRMPDDRQEQQRSGHGRVNSFSAADNRYGDDDRDMRWALAESKRSATATVKKLPNNYDEDAELRRAIEESAKEAKAVQEKRGGKAEEVDLLGGFGDSFGNTAAANNSAMMSSTSFSQQQQQLGNVQMGALGNAQFAGVGASNAAFDPFGLGANDSSLSMSGMNGMGGMGSMNNPYDNGGFGGSTNQFGGSTSQFGGSGNQFGGSTNQFVSQTTLTTTSLGMGMGMGGAGIGAAGNMFDNAGTGASGNMFDSASASSNAFNSAGMFSTAGSVAGANTANAADLLGGGNVQGTAGFDGASGAFGSAFDGGMGAKTLPFGVNPNDPNSKLAEIARNSNKIDPFASLAMGSAASSNPFGGTSSAMGGASSPFAMGTPGLAASSGIGGASGLMAASGSSLVDLSPAALSTSNTFQSFGQVSRNPFATTGGSSGLATGGGSKVSMNQMMAGSNNNSSAGFGQMGSNNVFGQQQQPQPLQQQNTGMSMFGGMQTPSMQTQQQMLFQQQQQQQQQQLQQQQQQQLNPFGQSTPSTNSQNNFFGL